MLNIGFSSSLYKKENSTSKLDVRVGLDNPLERLILIQEKKMCKRSKLMNFKSKYLLKDEKKAQEVIDSI